MSWWPLDGNGGYVGGTDRVRMGGVTPVANAGGTFGAINARLNAAATHNTGATAILQPYDLMTMNRAAAGTYTLMSGATPISTVAVASAALESANFTLLANQAISSFTSTAHIGFFLLGAALTELQQMQLRYAVRRYLLAVKTISDTSVSLTNGSSFFSLIGDSSKTFQTHNASKPWSFLKDGSRLRFDVRDGDYWPGDGAQDKNRSEIYSSSLWGYSADVWIACSVVLPPECDVTPALIFLLGLQLHAVDTLTASPPWAMIFAENDATTEYLRLQRLWDTTTANPPVFNREILFADPRSPVQRGKSFNAVYRCRFKQDNTGIYQAWLNGVQVVNLTNTNFGYAGDVSGGAYLKGGVYRGKTTVRTVLEIQNLRMSASSLANYIAAPLPLLS